MVASRVRWEDVPARVQDAVAELLGSSVVDAVSQPGGFSPGSADIVTCADGRRVFVKTATSDVNPEVVPIHRSEAAKAAVLPSVVPAPRFLGSADGDGWTVLTFELVDGRHPAVPWRDHELCAVLDALAATARAPLSAEARAVIPPIHTGLRPLAESWKELLAEPDPVVVPLTEADGVTLADAEDVEWAVRHAARWIAMADRGVELAAGDALVHFDVRADNVLLTPAGDAVLIDWPWALLGAPWVDAVMLLVDVRYRDPGLDVIAAMDSHEAFEGADAATIAAIVAPMAGFLLEKGRRPDPPGLPTLRRFQRLQGAAASRLLRELVG